MRPARRSAALLRPGNAGSNTADDHKAVLDLALAQIPAEHIAELEILVRADSAGATHGSSTTAARRTCGSRSATN